METYGLIVGLLLLLVVTATAWAIGARANSSVRQFREEHHQRFTPKDRA